LVWHISPLGIGTGKATVTVALATRYSIPSANIQNNLSALLERLSGYQNTKDEVAVMAHNSPSCWKPSPNGEGF
jgi:hypothetical protein